MSFSQKLQRPRAYQWIQYFRGGLIPGTTLGLLFQANINSVLLHSSYKDTSQTRGTSISHLSSVGSDICHLYALNVITNIQTCDKDCQKRMKYLERCKQYSGNAYNNKTELLQFHVRRFCSTCESKVCTL